MAWKLPPADHPIWKILQTALSIIMLLITVYHGMDGAHSGGVDPTDGVGVGGALIGGRLAWKALRRR